MHCADIVLVLIIRLVYILDHTHLRQKKQKKQMPLVFLRAAMTHDRWLAVCCISVWNLKAFILAICKRKTLRESVTNYAAI